MPDDAITWFGVPTILFLVGSAFWMNRRYRRFDRLPGHFDFKGRPTRLDPPWVMVWLVPLSLAVMMAAIMFSLWFVPAEMQNGDPRVGIAIAALGLSGSQAFIIWLVERWAKQQV